MIGKVGQARHKKTFMAGKDECTFLDKCTNVHPETNKIEVLYLLKKDQ